MRTLITSSLKLLFRNKSFWFFMVIVPILATFVLNTHQTNSISLSRLAEHRVSELDDADEKAAYYSSGGQFVVKVYDACGSELSGVKGIDLSDGFGVDDIIGLARNLL